ncbi:MAG: putative integral membrane protein (TIGR00697 family) [Sphingobacteriales bacterium]|jgi:uncharacterized integral membrane protein (TIGR00697 family)
MQSFKKEHILFLILGCFFIANALVAEFIGVKIFSVEESLGFDKFDINLFGIENLSFNMSAGVLMWPVVFIMTDIINEYFGKKGVKLLSYIATVLILYAFLMVFWGINLVPSDFWIVKPLSSGEINMDLAFNNIFGQGLWIIAGSIVAFLFGQLIDVYVFQKIKQKTGEKSLWLRATGSTVVSQFIDSFVVILIAFYIGADWSLELVLAIGFVNYFYKFIIAILLTPILYVVHYLIDKFLGPELSQELRSQALIK